MSATLNLARELVSRPSLTPDDAGCQTLMGERLAALGFELDWLPFGDVTNLWARRGTEGPLFAFAGHTDVVPPGPLENWTHPPFEAQVRDGYLHGRGAADMKGSLAAMITACEAFIAARPDHAGSIGFLITSDEEGPARDGTAKVVEHLRARDEQIDWCLIGEPSSETQLGDMVKNGRRGSLNARLVINGQQGHVAYPERACNPIHRFAPALAALGATQWDEGSEFFPPTSFQISNLNAGTGAVNVVPGSLETLFNFRYSTALTHDQLITRVESLLRDHALDYEIDWNHSGRPFLTAAGPLIDAVRTAIYSTTGIHTEFSTVGGTSDGRFIAPTGTQVIELGPVNATIHQIDECVRVQDLDTLAQIYQKVLDELL